MNKHSYEATIEVDDEKVKEFIKDLFGDTEEYAKRQKHFNNEKIKDALAFLNTQIEHDDVPPKLWDSIEILLQRCICMASIEHLSITLNTRIFLI